MKLEKIKIGEKVKIKGGKRLPKGREVVDFETDFPYIRVKDLELDRLNPIDIKYLTYDIHEKIKNYVIFDNEVYISIAGTIGRVGKIPSFLNGANLTENCAKFTDFSEDLDATYLMYYLRSSEGQGQINGKTGGASQPKLAITRIAEIEIPYCKIETQRKIASILSAYDDLIENNLRRIKILEEKAQLHYKELIQELSYSKTKCEEYIKNCLSFYIGGGWGEEEYKEKFTESAYVIRGTDIPEVRKGDIKNVPFRHHKESNLSSRKLEGGDIIFEVSGGSKGQSVGRSLFITEKLLNQFIEPVMCASFCKLLRTNDKISPEYFYCYLIAGYENGIIAQYEKHSASNIVNYGFEEFIREQKIKIPKDTDLNSFTEKVKRIFTLIATLGNQNSKLREARDILLPRLMSGEVEV